MEWAMKKTGNNVSRAAGLLGLPRSTLRSKMKKN
ncbi:MAG: helix-turn-helix domain-containing protein [Calditrichales bacterium]|nr:helix-turn-helix domain-containing protein [Calditrichales bacterium]